MQVAARYVQRFRHSSHRKTSQSVFLQSWRPNGRTRFSFADHRSGLPEPHIRSPTLARVKTSDGKNFLIRLGDADLRRKGRKADMSIIGLCVLVLAFILLQKGLPYALCFLPGMILFAAANAYISNMLTPDRYPGDFLDMFLPLVTVPIQIFLVLLAGGLAVLLSRFVLQLAGVEPHPLVWPLSDSAPRLVGVALLTIAGAALIALDLGWSSLMRYEQRRSEEQAAGRANDAISKYSEERISEGDIVQIIKDLPREVSCARSFAPEVEKLLQGNDVAKAVVLVRALDQSCFDSPTLDELLRNRQYDGTIHDLNILLAIGVASHSRLLEAMGKYALLSGNDDDFLVLLAHFLDAEDGKEASSGALRTLLLMLAEGGGGKKELLSRFFAKAGPEPLRYLIPDDLDTLSSAFLGSAANNLDPDSLKFYIDMGFDKERTRYGSTFFSFVHARGGPAILQRLIDEGADVNALDAQGFTPLLALLWRPEMDRTPYEPGQEQKALEIFDLLFALNDYRLYATPGGENMLHRACSAGRYSPEGVAEIKVLLKAGADPSLTGKGLATPAEMAEKHGWNQARDLLLEAAKK